VASLPKLDDETRAGIGAGDPVAIDRACWLLKRPMQILALRIMREWGEAEDIAMIVLERAFLERRFGELHALEAWLMRATINEAKDLVKREVVRRGNGVSESKELEADWRTDPLRAAEVRDTRDAIEQALKELPAMLRESFELEIVDGRSVEEVAGLLGISRGNVRMRVYRARQLLRQRLEAFREVA